MRRRYDRHWRRTPLSVSPMATRSPETPAPEGRAGSRTLRGRRGPRGHRESLPSGLNRLRLRLSTVCSPNTRGILLTTSLACSPDMPGRRGVGFSGRNGAKRTFPSAPDRSLLPGPWNGLPVTRGPRPSGHGCGSHVSGGHVASSFCGFRTRGSERGAPDGQVRAHVGQRLLTPVWWVVPTNPDVAPPPGPPSACRLL